MPKNKPIVNSTIQKGKAGRDSTQVGGNYHQTTNSNNRIIISLVVIVAFGGLAIAAYVAKDLIHDQDQNQPNPTELQLKP